MKQYDGYNIIGTSVSSAIEGMGAFRSHVIKILEDNGIKNLKLNELNN